MSGTSSEPSTKTTALTNYGEQEAIPIPHNDDETNNTPTAIELDSLPYIDEVHPDYEAYAITLIEEEMQTMPPPAPFSPDPRIDNNGIPHSFPNNSINHTEYASLLSRNGSPRPNPIDYTQTYTQPPSTPPTTLTHHQTKLTNAKLQLSHQQSRLLSLELQSQPHALALWKTHVSHTLPVHYQQPVEAALHERRMAVDESNAERKRMQEVEAGPRLKVAEARWMECVGRNRRLRGGIGVVRSEVDRLRGLVTVDGV